MIDIIQGSSAKPISSKELADLFQSYSRYNGQLYIGYPIFATPDGRYPIDAIFLSPDKGVVLFDLIEGIKLPDDFKEHQDDAVNKLEAKLRNHKILMKGRKLKVPINIITFAPAVNKISEDDEYPFC